MPHAESDASGYRFTDTAFLPWRPSTVVEGVEIKIRHSQWLRDGARPLPAGNGLPHASPCRP